jgi:hypothetical protein
VPKEDSQVQRLLASRRDIFTGYHRQAFEEAFRSRFDIEQAQPIAGSQRMVYLMRSRP